MDNFSSTILERELGNFLSRTGFVINKPASEIDIQKAECLLNCTFGKSMKEFLMECNGATFMNFSICGVPEIGKNVISDGFNIVEVNKTFKDMLFWSNNWVVVGLDGCGCYFAFDSSIADQVGEHPVLFIDLEKLDPEYVPNRIADNFLSFILSIFKDLKVNYLPDGSNI